MNLFLVEIGKFYEVRMIESALKNPAGQPEIKHVKVYHNIETDEDVMTCPMIVPVGPGMQAQIALVIEGAKTPQEAFAELPKIVEEFNKEMSKAIVVPGANGPLPPGAPNPGGRPPAGRW